MRGATANLFPVSVSIRLPNAYLRFAKTIPSSSRILSSKSIYVGPGKNGGERTERTRIPQRDNSAAKFQAGGRMSRS